MTESVQKGGRTPARNAAIVDLVVQISCLALLTYWTFILVKPFLIVIIWSVILAVVLYPVFDWTVRRLRVHRVVAALSIIILSLVILLGPAAWLGLSLIETVRSVAERIGTGEITVPPPPAALKTWPLVGDEAYQLWSLASTNLKDALVQIGPALEPFRDTLLDFAGSAGVSMLKFIVAVPISGFLLLPGPKLANYVRLIFRRITARHGDEFVNLIAATTRNLARGVIGLSLVQGLLAGLGLIVAGIPAAGLFSFLILVFGIIQIDAAIILGPIIIWSWITMDTGPALLFSIYTAPVALLNNFLRPFVMAHGLKTPMLIILIGVIGGILAHGVIGVFVGPIVLAIAWDLLMAWSRPPSEHWGRAAT